MYFSGQTLASLRKEWYTEGNNTKSLFSLTDLWCNQKSFEKYQKREHTFHLSRLFMIQISTPQIMFPIISGNVCTPTEPDNINMTLNRIWYSYETDKNKYLSERYIAAAMNL